MRCKITEIKFTQYLTNFYAKQYIFTRNKFQHKIAITFPNFTKLYAEFYKRFVDLCKTYQNKRAKQQKHSIFTICIQSLTKKSFFIDKFYS